MVALSLFTSYATLLFTPADKSSSVGHALEKRHAHTRSALACLKEVVDLLQRSSCRAGLQYGENA